MLLMIERIQILLRMNLVVFVVAAAAAACIVETRVEVDPCTFDFVTSVQEFDLLCVDLDLSCLKIQSRISNQDIVFFLF